ncbi:helix-turn-helix domain-containing protein, partial [Nonomuraea lactucae]|uniref:helix-turn-helix domain-containing protein n=1 Tax=Nonomuraea lactucae TaxID=2249762 RepID=UPI001F06BFD7
VDAALVAAEQAGGAGTPASALALARARLARGEPVAHLVRLALAMSASVPPDVSVDGWLLDAYLSYEEEDSSKGRRSLDRALRVADREQIRLPFALCRVWLQPVLRQDPELARPYERLLGPLRLGSGRPARAAEMETAAVEKLSTRELDVLRRLAGMMTTDEIADELCLSVNTIKTHLKSIYRKLGVTRRGEAVRRARRLSLLRD